LHNFEQSTCSNFKEVVELGCRSETHNLDANNAKGASSFFISSRINFLSKCFVELDRNLLHDWLMKKDSLAGRRILLTRAAGQMQVLEQAVQSRGGTPVLFPCLQVHALPEEIQQAMLHIDNFSDVLFTSSNGVDSVAVTVGDLRAALLGKRVAAVGDATAMALKAAGVTAAIVPSLASQDGLMQAYGQQGLPSGLLFFRALEGRDYLEQAMAEAGVPVEMVSAYETICPLGDASDIIRLLRQGDIDAVLLGSSKAARYYVQRILSAGDIALADRPAIAVLSEQVKAAALDAGLSVQVVAKQASFDALLDELAAYFNNPEYP